MPFPTTFTTTPPCRCFFLGVGSLAAVGGKGLFTIELEQSLRNGSIGLAVHSAKDLPVDMSDDFVIAAVPPREYPLDALVSRCGGLEDLPKGAKVATGSLRRRGQLLAVRGDLKIVPIRGNVETRLKKVLDEDSNDVDATVLAMAGLKRSGLWETHEANICTLDEKRFIPAAGQGSLAIQTMVENKGIIKLLGALDDSFSHQSLSAERAVVLALGASCHSCMAVHIFHKGESWSGRAMAGCGDGSGIVNAEAAGRDAEGVSEALVEALKKQGATNLLSS